MGRLQTQIHGWPALSAPDLLFKPVSVVCVDVPAGSIARAHAPQSSRTAHPCMRSPHRAEPDRQMDRDFDHMQAHGCFDLFEITHALGTWLHLQGRVW